MADENETAEAAKQIKEECKKKFSHRKRNEETKRVPQKEHKERHRHVLVQKDYGGGRWSNHHK
jgi:hypothetical protein